MYFYIFTIIFYFVCLGQNVESAHYIRPAVGGHDDKQKAGNCVFYFDAASFNGGALLSENDN